MEPSRKTQSLIVIEVDGKISRSQITKVDLYAQILIKRADKTSSHRLCITSTSSQKAPQLIPSTSEWQHDKERPFFKKSVYVFFYYERGMKKTIDIQFFDHNVLHNLLERLGVYRHHPHIRRQLNSHHQEMCVRQTRA